MIWHRISLALLLCTATLLPGRAFANDLLVNPSVACAKGDEADAVYCTIQAAIDAAFAQGGGNVQVVPGVYVENLILREDVSVQGEGDGEVVIQLAPGTLPTALVVAADDSGLHGVTLRLPEGRNAAIPMLLIKGVEDVEIEEVIFDGGMNRQSIGVFVQNQLLETSQIKECELRRLEVGVLAEDTRFRITRCLFEDILRDGIHVRPPSSKGLDDGDFESPEIGDDDDLEFSGFNRFRNIGGFSDSEANPINEGDSFFLRNTTGVPLVAQLNDWGVYDVGGIAAGLSLNEPGAKSRVTKGSDAAVFQPFLGKSIFPGSVFCRIRNAATLAVLTNANPRLRLGALDTGIAPAFDAVSKLYSFTFINPDTYEILAQAPGFLSATRSAIVGPGDIFAADIALDSDGVVEGEPVDSPHTTDQNANGLVDLSELLRVVQLYNASAYRCDAVGEDGYSVGGGSTSCPPHAGDYAPQDWSISLSEALRSVQFFNLGGYYPCVGSEDGYCPGQPR